MFSVYLAQKVITNVSVMVLTVLLRCHRGLCRVNLAEALETHINQIMDASTGETVGGVTVRYSSDTNNFVFTTGTTGNDSTIKVKVICLGLDDVPLGVGSVPEIYNLVQATNADGVGLFVAPTGSGNNATR